MLDPATGQTSELAWTREPARYEANRFTPDGAGIVTISDLGSDLRRLVEIGVASGRRRPLTPELKWDVEGYDMSDDGRLIAYVVNEDGYSRVRIVERGTSRELARPDLPGGLLTGLDSHPTDAGSRSASRPLARPATCGPGTSPPRGSPAGPSPSLGRSTPPHWPSRS